MLVFLQNTSVGESLAAPMAPVGTFTCENTTPFAVQRQYHQSKSCCIQHNTGHSSETVPPVKVLLHPTRHRSQFRDSTTSQSLAASNTMLVTVQRQYHQSKSCCIQHNTGQSSETVPPVSLAASNTMLVTVQRQYHQPKSCCIQHNADHSSETGPPAKVLLHPTQRWSQFRDSTASQSCCIQHNTGHSSETVPSVKVLLHPTNMSEVRRTFMPKSD